jgi:hypothetical protein
MSRFNSRVKALNDNEMYENTFDQRGVKQVVQYTTEELIYPDEEDKKRINVAQHAWTSGDTMEINLSGTLLPSGIKRQQRGT